MNAPFDPNRPQFGGFLSDYMADLADEVQPVDLRDRVRASSRRLAVRRTAVAATAVVAALVVASGVAWAGLSGMGGPDRQPADSSPSAPTPGPTTPTAVPSSAVPTTSSPTPNATASGGIPSTLYYLTFDGTRQHLRVWQQGQVREILSPRTAACGLAVSPNHKRVAWTTTDGGGATGDLVVARIDGTGQRTVLRGVSCTGGNAPFWLPDSRHMLIAQGNTAPRVLVDVDTGALTSTPLTGVIEYVAWSPNGRRVAYASHGEIVVARPDGTVDHRVRHGDETPTGGFSVQGISDDGLVAVIGIRNTDPDQIRTGYRLVNTVTGKTIPLPGEVAPTTATQASVYPLTDGQLLLRVRRSSEHTLYLINANGKVTAHKAEPAALGNAILLPPPTH
jgi:TolB protein